MVWYVNGKAVMKASIPDGTRKMSDWQIIINVSLGGNLVENVAPVDGVYELVVHSLQLHDAPAGGWGQFDRDWNAAPEGHTMPV